MKRTIFLLVVVFLAGLAGASFEISGNQTFIEKQYSGGEIVKGKLNISFAQQENAMFESNFDGGIRLLELLEKMGYEKNYNFSCEPADCTDDYEPIGNGLENFPVVLGKVYGFEINGEDVKILDMKFELESNAGESCGNQILIDLFDDNKIDFRNMNYSEEPCELIEEDYGCFNSDEETDNLELDHYSGSLYCNNVTLEPAPGYEVGARVEGNGQWIELWLYDENGKIKSCKDVPNNGIAKCIIDVNKDDDFKGWVCVSKYNPSDSYFIRSEDKGNVCGGAGNPENGLSGERNYEVYARPLKYSPVGKINFNSDEYEKQNEDSNSLIEVIDKFIEEKYDRNCEEKCIVPFLINGQIGQTVKINNALLKYRDSGNIKNENEIYLLSDSQFTINSEHIILDIEKMNFKVPNNEEETDFRLELGGSLIFTEEVEITEGFDFRLIPESGLLGRSVQFRLKSSENITSSTWNFGDGSEIIESNDNTAVHVFTNSSVYEIKVSAFSNGKTSTKKFSVAVGNAKTSANITINEYETRLKRIESSINKFPSWLKEIVEERMGLDEIKTDIRNIKSRFSLAVNEEEYEDIAIALSSLDVPHDVVIAERGALSLVSGIDDINTELIAELSELEIENEEEVKRGIVTWMEGRYEPEVNFESVKLQKGSYMENLLSYYYVKMNQLAETEDVFLIIEHPESTLEFKGQVGEKSLSRGVYVEIDGSDPEDIEFVVFGEEVKIRELGVYLSPKLESLNLLGNIEIVSKQGFNYARLFTWLIVVLVLMFAVYIATQTWYKRHYEKHLFKNPNDLYNLINFVYNSRKSGLKEKEMKRKLLEKNWGREQIVYAVKKLDGKRTGMWEIPIFKFVENKRVKKELEKKNPGKEIDARFIKMPDLE